VRIVERSTELEAVVGRLFAAINARDLPTVLNLFADEPGIVHIGTDPDEWLSTYEATVVIFEAQLGEFDAGAATYEPGEVEAYSEGTVGWAAFRPTLVLPDGTTAALRGTAVLHLDRGVWRFVQTHLSAGVENEETFGFELTTLENLAAAVQEERPDLAGAAADDGTVTIAFSDIEGSTEVAVRLGDRKWLELLSWHDDVVADLAAREGGHVVKSLGDGHMLAFSSASRALRSAASIQRSFRQPHEGESLRLRIGLHTGEVLRRADDFFGRAVIMASRIASTANGDEILASSLVVELVTGSADAFTFGEPRSAELKGIPGEHLVFPLVWADVQPTV
jgi:class 3 adenylate cyclase